MNVSQTAACAGRWVLFLPSEPHNCTSKTGKKDFCPLLAPCSAELSPLLAFFFFFWHKNPRCDHTCAFRSSPPCICFPVLLLDFPMAWNPDCEPNEFPACPPPPSTHRPLLGFTATPRLLGTNRCSHLVLKVSRQKQGFDRICPNPVQTKSLTFLALTPNL